MIPTHQQIIDFAKEIRKMGKIMKGKRYDEQEFKTKITALIPHFQKIGRQDLADNCKKYEEWGTNTNDFLWELKIEEQYGNDLNNINTILNG